jgi:aryl-alcohol dehydrogenase-like predicted oxidoreductase
MLVRNKVEAEFAQIYKTVGLGTTIWSPLASGLLTGKYNQGIADDFRLQREELSWLKDQNLVEENLNKVKRLTAFAAELGITPAQMAVAWTLVNPNVSTAILGASRVEQLRENLRALDHVSLLTPEVMETLEGILQNKPVLPPY